MPSLVANTVIQTVLWFRQNDSAVNAQMAFTHRVDSGEASDDELNASWMTQVETLVYPKLLPVISTGCWIMQIKARRLYPTLGVWWQKSYASTDHVGGGSDEAVNPPCASLCIVRNSYVPGRSGQDKLYLPFLSNDYIDRGVVAPGAGLATLRLALTGPSVTLTLAPATPAKGCIVRAYKKGEANPPVSGMNDVRNQFYGRLVTYRKSRRPTIGW